MLRLARLPIGIVVVQKRGSFGSGDHAGFLSKLRYKHPIPPAEEASSSFFAAPPPASDSRSFASNSGLGWKILALVFRVWPTDQIAPGRKRVILSSLRLFGMCPAPFPHPCLCRGVPPLHDTAAQPLPVPPWQSQKMPRVGSSAATRACLQTSHGWFVRGSLGCVLLLLPFIRGTHARYGYHTPVAWTFSVHVLACASKSRCRTSTSCGHFLCAGDVKLLWCGLLRRVVGSVFLETRSKTSSTSPRRLKARTSEHSSTTAIFKILYLDLSTCEV